MYLQSPIRKVTISLPADLVEYADQQARATNTSRSQVIGAALTAVREDTVAQLAAEGYRFYAAESDDFADATNRMVAESWTEV
jgi:hypothetical protein